MSTATALPSEAPERLPETHYWNATKGWKSWAFTVDHKRIGMMYLMAILAAFFGSVPWTISPSAIRTKAAKP